jgi:hypothetical protein
MKDEFEPFKRKSKPNGRSREAEEKIMLWLGLDRRTLSLSLTHVEINI